MLSRIVKTILIAVFIFLAIVVVLPLAAEWQFNDAQRLASAYLWEKAEIKFQKAVTLNPLDARYFSGFADFLKDISPYRQDEIFLLWRAKYLYDRALELNPLRAEYALGSGQVQLKLFLKDKNRYRNELDAGIENFKRAVKSDPNGFNIAYEVGYGLMGVWPYLDAGTKRLVIERLRYVLQQRSWFWVYIYPWAWKNAGDFEVLQHMAPAHVSAHRDLLYFIEMNSLCSFYRREIELLNFYMKKDEPEKFAKESQEKLERIEALKKKAQAKDVILNGEWQGKSDYGNNEFENGKICWTGTIYGVLDMPIGETALAIQAKGSQANGIYPYMIVELDGEEVGETFVNSEGWKDYAFKTKTGTGLKVLSITFCNDGVNEEKHEDRNLYIGEARIQK